MQLPKVCLFDAFGTLFQVTMPVAALDQETNGQGEALLNLWRKKQLEYTWLRGLMGAWVDFDQVTEDALNYATQTLGIQNDRLPEILMPIYRQPTIFDDVLICLAFLKEQDVKTAILSNGTPAMLQAGIQKTGLDQYLETALSASKAQTFKVSPKVYQMALNHFAVPQEEVWFFSSNAWDIAGASHFGLTTIWVNRAQQVFEELGTKPSAILGGLHEIQTIWPKK